MHSSRIRQRALLLILVAGLALQARGSVLWDPWCGGVTQTSAVVKAKVPAGRARLVISRTPDLLDHPRAVTPAPLRDNKILAFEIPGLEPATSYYYGLELNGVLSAPPHARLNTFPRGAASFTFAFGSCARTGSSHAVFDTIRAKEPLFFLHTGDLHYSDIKKNDRQLFRQAFDAVLASPAQSRLMRNLPFLYIWDDHDYGPNRSDAKSPGQRASRLTYQEYVPHYPLGDGVGDVAIYQVFTAGRVRFILTDLRSERDSDRMTDGSGKSMLGSEQKRWFKDQLLKAKAEAGLIFWISSVPWIGTSAKSDSWSAYATERREIANFIKRERITNLCIIAGDAHMLAADNGINSDYADGGGARIPVLHGSPLDQKASFKGGPYSEGNYLAAKGEGCFGFVEISDEGTQLAVQFTGRNHLDEVKLTYRFAVQTSAAPAIR